MYNILQVSIIIPHTLITTIVSIDIFFQHWHPIIIVHIITP